MANNRVYIVVDHTENSAVKRLIAAAETVVKKVGNAVEESDVDSLRNAIADASRPVLVRASSQAQAIRHVQPGPIEAKVATQDECIQLACQGVKVQEAGE